MSTLSVETPRAATSRDRRLGLTLVGLLGAAGLVYGYQSTAIDPPLPPAPQVDALAPSRQPDAQAYEVRQVLIGMVNAPQPVRLATSPAPRPSAAAAARPRAAGPPPTVLAAQEEPPSAVSAGDAALDAAATVTLPLDVVQPPTVDHLVTPQTPERLR